MGKNDWNSLQGHVKWQRSYASSEAEPLIGRYCFAACALGLYPQPQTRYPY